MKKRSILNFSFSLFVAVAAASCSTTPMVQTFEKPNPVFANAGQKAIPLSEYNRMIADKSFTAKAVTSTVTIPLIAGQHHDAGIVTAIRDGDNILVTYKTKPGWYIKETHLAIASSKAGIPANKKEIPKTAGFLINQSMKTL